MREVSGWLRVSPAGPALVVIALLAAGCGGSRGGASRSPTSSESEALAYADCQRSHGVSNWPDPNSSGVFDKSKVTLQQLGISSSRLQAALAACRHLLPNGGRPPDQAERQQLTAKALRFSRCVRAHGVPSFPDPGSDGRIPDPARVGVDQGSPKFEAANQACAADRPPYMPSNAAYNAYARGHG
jgi:hypothetical protein